MSEWGNRGDNPNDKPKFPWIVKGNKDMFNHGGNNETQTVATEKGWVYRWPWGDEVLVGIGGLVNPNSSSTSPSGSVSPSSSKSASKSPSSSASPSASDSASISPSSSKSASVSPSSSDSASVSPSSSVSPSV